MTSILKSSPVKIVGIAGVEGNGQTELVQVLTGLRQIDSGILTLNGERVAHIPADRHRHGISLNDRIDDNFIIGHHKRRLFCRKGLLRRQLIQRATLNALHKYQILVGSIMHPIRTLSGGNQQKIVVARELGANPEVIIAAHPTRGLDIHAAEFVHTRLIYARNRGKAVLLVSSELDELLHLSDRIAVMSDGKIVGIVKPTETDKRELGGLDAGAENRCLITDYSKDCLTKLVITCLIIAAASNNHSKVWLAGYAKSVFFTAYRNLIHFKRKII